MIAIVGGGIARLAAAYELSIRKVPFRLYEASPRLGGLVRTEHIGGFTIEAGADSMLAQKPAALDLCKALGLEAKLISPREPKTAFVLHHGALHPLPVPSLLGIPATWAGLATYSLLPPLARARIALEPLIPSRRDSVDESIASFFRRRFGAASVDLVAQPLLGGIHAGSIERLSLPASFHDSPRRKHRRRASCAGSRRLPRPRGGGAAFRSMESGMGELVDALQRCLPAESIWCGAAVTSLTRTGRGWKITTPAGPSQHSAVLLACPAHAASSLLAPSDSEAATLCAAVRYVSTVSLALAWPRAAVKHPLRGSGFVVARKSNATRITAATWVSSKWAGRAPDGHVLLRAYVGGEHDESAVMQDDDSLIDTATRELSEILSITGSPELTRVYRWPNAGDQHLFVEASRRAYSERRLAGADPDFQPADATATLVARCSAARTSRPANRRSIAITPRPPPPSLLPRPRSPPSPQTTHFSVVDAEGNAVVHLHAVSGLWLQGRHPGHRRPPRQRHGRLLDHRPQRPRPGQAHGKLHDAHHRFAEWQARAGAWIAGRRHHSQHRGAGLSQRRRLRADDR